MADAPGLDAVRRALAEDRVLEDVTTRLLGDAAKRPAAMHFVAEEPLVVAGVEAAELALREVDGSARFERCVAEGSLVDAGAAIAVAAAPAGVLLAAERVMLNFIQRLSGVATTTRRAVDAVAGTSARITHTRKTTPGLRPFELEAVRLGGGVLNRASLADAIMWKDNHWAMLPSPDGLAAALAAAPAGLEVIIEVESEAQLEAALAAGVRHLLVDNQTPEVLAAWAKRAGPNVTIQASGGIGVQNAREYALAGAHLIAIGALTHSARAASVRCDVVTADCGTP